MLIIFIDLFVTFVPILGKGLEWALDRADVVAYKRRLSWTNVTRGIRRVATGIQRSGFQPDIIIGSGRSGSIVGAWVAGELGNRSYATIDIAYDRINGVRTTRIVDHGRLDVSGNRVLLVSSEHKSGETSRAEREYLIKQGASEVRCATLVQYSFSTHTADFCGYTMERETEFPWRMSGSFPKRS